MECGLEKECSALGGLFQTIVNDMKGGYPAWEDCGAKAGKLSFQLKATISAINLFLDALQKVADVATNAKGATRDLGTALTRICMRHRSIENRLKSLSSALIDHLVSPLHEKAEDWRQRATNLDKEHAREYKKMRTDIKKRAADTMRLQKKVRKGGNMHMQPMLDSAVHEVNDRYFGLLQAERKMVKKALIEQRSQFCLFVSWLKPVLDFELGLLEEISHLQDVTDLLCRHAADPYTLPPASENVIFDVKGLEHTLGMGQHFETPPSSPSNNSMGSRKSSFCSLSSSESSALPTAVIQGAGSGVSRAGTKQQGAARARNGAQTVVVHGPFLRQASQAPASPRFSSMSSQDSGIAASHDVIYAPPTQKNIPNSDEDSSTPGSLEGAVGESPESQQSTPSPSPSAVTWPAGPPSAHMAALLAAGSSNSHYRVPLKLTNQQQVQGGTKSDDGHVRPHTISAVYESRGVRQRATLASVGFNQGMTRPATLGVPKGKKSATTTPLQTPTPTLHQTVPEIPDFNAAQPDQIMLQPIYANVSDLNTPGGQRRQRGASVDTPIYGEQCFNGGSPWGTNGRSRRPSSFVGDDEDIQKLLEAAGMYCGASEGSGGATTRSSVVSGSETIKMDEEDEKTLIEDCVGQIDQLSTDLDQYISRSAPDKKKSVSTEIVDAIDSLVDNSESKLVELASSSPYCTLPRNTVKWRQGDQQGSGVARPTTLPRLSENSPPRMEEGEGFYSTVVGSGMGSRGGTLTRRHSTTSGKPPPPPPARKCSSITAATPTAPAVDMVRSSSRCTTPVEDSCYTMMQSLNVVRVSGNSPAVSSPSHQVSQQGNFPEKPAPPPQQDLSVSGTTATVFTQKPTNHQPPRHHSVASRRASEPALTPPPAGPHFSVIHETMLMQIRNGVKLRKTSPTSEDRGRKF